MTEESTEPQSARGPRILEGLRQAAEGEFSSVMIEGQTWVRRDSDLASELAHARDEIARLQAFIDRDWKKTTELWLKGAGPAADGSFGFDIQGTIIPLIVEHLAQTFKSMGGENYVNMEFRHEELGPLLLSLQRLHGELPGAKAARLEKEVEQHLEDKRVAHRAMKQALSLCQHEPSAWLEMEPELREFKLKIFGILDVPTCQAGNGIRGDVDAAAEGGDA